MKYIMGFLVMGLVSGLISAITPIYLIIDDSLFVFCSLIIAITLFVISFRRSTEKHLKSKLGYSAILALCTYAFVLSLSTFLVVAHTQSNYNQEVQLGKKMKSNAIICVSINSMQNKVLCSSKDVFNSTFKLGFIKLPMFLSVSFDQGDGVIVKEYK
ncbi:MAG: hypothetical protein CME66_00465 [Halobacteriovoraceae bacterium]|jgi:heme/copper-type cytochrome/quinol oxidase subunit 4|nr:hypothetical protein [Halobacteriovoraceae bacterium]|tara:strand:+ start:529 stop:999 length:471 start_codon:yes stop_codon:yes gene_type:complete